MPPVMANVPLLREGLTHFAPNPGRLHVPIVGPRETRPLELRCHRIPQFSIYVASRRANRPKPPATAGSSFANSSFGCNHDDPDIRFCPRHRTALRSPSERPTLLVRQVVTSSHVQRISNQEVSGDRYSRRIQVRGSLGRRSPKVDGFHKIWRCTSAHRRRG